MRRLGLVLLGSGVVAAAIAACDKKHSTDECAFFSNGAGATAQFHLDSACPTNPFPSDVLRNGASIAVPSERVGYVMPGDARFDIAREYLRTTSLTLDGDGFSPLAPIVIPLSHPIDPATAAAGVKLFVVTTGASATITADTTHTFTASWDGDFRALLLQPDTPLEEQTEYGIVVTTELKDMAQQPTNRSPDFARYLHGTPSPEIQALVNGAGVLPDHVSLAFTFRTQTITAGLVSIRDQIFSPTSLLGSSLLPQFTNPDPQLVGLDAGYFVRGTANFKQNIQDNATLTTDLVPNIGAVATGTFDAYKFRDDPALPFNPAYVFGGQLGPTEHIQFRVTIPTGPMPAGGWPVLLYQHGLGGSAVDVYDIGNQVAAYGWAAIATEAVAHGRRGGVFEIFNWDSMPATRDNFRESVADDLQLLRLLRNAHADASVQHGFEQLDANNVTFMGISLGGILGGTFTALAPNVPDSALVVPGGHLAFELTAKAVGKQYLWNFVSSRAGINPITDEPDFLIFVKGFELLVQTGLDPCDPANYGVHVKTPGRQLGVEAKNVLIQESHGDNWVPNDENETLRRAIGIPLVTTSENNAAGISAAWVYTTSDFPALASQGEPHGWWDHLCNERVQTFTWIDTHAQKLTDPLQTTCTN